MSVVAGCARWFAWSVVLRLVAGLRVSGRRPRRGGCVVVANHASHADTAALLAALGPRPVAVLAAADYWTGWRGEVCSALAGGVAVRRTGGGSRDLEPVVDLLRRGTTVVVFPEGTRGDSESVGRFRSGAAVLAAAAGVPVVPAAVAGTARLLPRHGRLRPHPVEVRFGDALPPGAAPDDARAAVERLLAQCRPRWRGARVTGALQRFALRPRALLVVAAWAAAEALSWPVIPELAVVALALVAPRRAPALAAVALAGSTLGLLVALPLAGAGTRLPQPATTPAMAAAVAQAYDERSPFDATRGQALSGIPSKLYAAEAGRRELPPGPVTAGWLVGRGARLLVVAGLAAAAGRLLRGPLLAPALGLGAVGFALGWARVVAAWQ